MKLYSTEWLAKPPGVFGIGKNEETKKQTLPILVRNMSINALQDVFSTLSRAMLRHIEPKVNE
jgi:hypothetical protein